MNKTLGTWGTITKDLTFVSLDTRRAGIDRHEKLFKEIIAALQIAIDQHSKSMCHIPYSYTNLLCLYISVKLEK